MSDTPSTPTAETPTDSDKSRKAPPTGEVVTEIPQSTRQSGWSVEFEWFKDNVGTVKRYSGISPTTASYLRREYGLEAHSRNTRKVEGSTVCDLYVVYKGAEAAQALKDRPVKHRAKKADKAASPTAAKPAGK